MLELLDALREREVTVSVVSGGGTELVRAVSRDLYGVPPELVVGRGCGAPPRSTAPPTRGPPR
jgi:hypothetical protein